jgi:hypothetical protein
MKNNKANELISKITKEVSKKGIQPDNLIEELKELRELSILENDPLVTRSIRMAYEHLENNDGWDYEVIKADEEDDEPELDASPEEHFLYLLSLWEKSDNTYNRDEIRQTTNELVNA